MGIRRLGWVDYEYVKKSEQKENGQKKFKIYTHVNKINGNIYIGQTICSIKKDGLIKKVRILEKQFKNMDGIILNILFYLKYERLAIPLALADGLRS